MPERTRFFLGVAGLLAILAGMLLLAFRDAQAFFDLQTIAGMALTAVGAVLSFLFRPGAKPRMAKPVSWTGPAAVIGLLIATAAMGALLFFGKNLAG